VKTWLPNAQDFNPRFHDAEAEEFAGVFGEEREIF